MKLVGFRGIRHLRVPPVWGVPHSALYPGLRRYRSIHVRSATDSVASGTAVAVACGMAVAVEPAGVVGAGDVAVEDGDVASPVGVAESPAHAKATIIMVPARIAMISLSLDTLRTNISHILFLGLRSAGSLSCFLLCCQYNCVTPATLSVLFTLLNVA